MRWSGNYILLLVILFSFGKCLQAAPNTDSLFLNKIIIHGNKITKPGVILREILLHEGEWMDTTDIPQLIAQSKDQLTKTALFNSIAIHDSSYADTFDIYIDVKERWYIIPTFHFALADRNFNAWWESKELYRTTYGVEIAFNNFRGRNETLVSSLVLGWRTQLGLSYTVPYLNRKKTWGAKLLGYYEQGHELGLSTTENRLRYFRYDPDILIATRTAGLALTHRRKFFLTHSFSCQYYNVHIHDTVARLNSEYLGKGATQLPYIVLGYQVTYDKRDAITYPLTGNLIVASVQYLTDLTAQNSFSTPYFFVRIHHFQPLPYRLNYAIGLSSKISTNTGIPYIFQNSLGYEDYVRGYEHFVINGQAYFLLRNEMRKEIFAHTWQFDFIPIPQINTVPIRIYAKIFMDNGYVSSLHADQRNSLQNSWQRGYGIGIDVVSYYDKSMRLEYSINGFGQRELFLHFDEAF